MAVVRSLSFCSYISSLARKRRHRRLGNMTAISNKTSALDLFYLLFYPIRHAMPQRAQCQHLQTNPLRDFLFILQRYRQARETEFKKNCRRGFPSFRDLSRPLAPKIRSFDPRISSGPATNCRGRQGREARTVFQRRAAG